MRPPATPRPYNEVLRHACIVSCPKAYDWARMSARCAQLPCIRGSHRAPAACRAFSASGNQHHRSRHPRSRSYASMSKFGKETNIPLKGLARNDSYMSVDEPYRGPLTR